MAEAQEGKENGNLLYSLIRVGTPYLCVAGRNEPLGMDGRGGLVGIHRIYALPEGDSRLHPLSPQTDESGGNSAGIACRRDACRCLPDEEGFGRRKAADVEGVSVRAIAGQPWRGYGWDGVPGAYGQAQEDYFSAGNYTETEERVAGSPEYVFNEYLQVAMAWGVPVLLMALLVVGGSGYAGHRQKEYGLCGALLSLAVFSFSSYPFQFLLFVVALALLVTGCAIKTLSSRRPLVCMAGTVFLLLSAGYGCYRVYRWKEVRETASSAWHRKQMFYRSGAYEQAAEVYAEIYEDMKWNARYLFEYGHALHKLHRNEESNVVMKEALKVSGDPMILNIIGKNEQEAGNYAEAEYWLIRSTHRLPGRIYPYFLLAKLYAEPGFYQRQKLEQAARMVMEKEPKVQSTAIRQMREEIKKLL